MTAQSVASRSRPPHRHEPDDVVMARALEFSSWARANVRLIVAGAVVVLVVLGGLLWYRTYQANRQEQAATSFMQLEQTVGAGNPALAVQELERFIARFDGTDYAAEARLVLARLQLQQSQPAAAVEAVQPLADRGAGTTLGAQAGLLLAAAQQAAGQPEQAVQTYLRVADGSDMSYQQIEALSSAALLRMEAGDYAGAAELYDRAVALTAEGSAERAIFEMRRAEARALGEAAPR